MNLLIPDVPEEPDVPANPEVPDEPATPDVPDEPLVPGIPWPPEDPEEPDVPASPEEPEVPEDPDVPEFGDILTFVVPPAPGLTLTAPVKFNVVVLYGTPAFFVTIRGTIIEERSIVLFKTLAPLLL